MIDAALRDESVRQSRPKPPFQDRCASFRGALPESRLDFQNREFLDQASHSTIQLRITQDFYQDDGSQNRLFELQGSVDRFDVATLAAAQESDE